MAFYDIFTPTIGAAAKTSKPSSHLKPSSRFWKRRPMTWKGQPTSDKSAYVVVYKDCHNLFRIYCAAAMASN